MPTTHPAARPPRSRALRAAAALAAMTALAAACADEASGGDGGAGAAAAGDLGTIEGALATLPAWDGDDLVTVTYGDAVVAAELAGVDAPDDPADAGALVPWVNAMTGIAVRDGTTATAALLLPERIGAERMSEHGEFADELGFSLLDVERFVERDTPPERVSVFEGDIGEDDLDEAIGGADDGVWLVGDPEGGLQVDEVSPARPVGESLWLTLADGQLTIAGTEGDIDDVSSGLDEDASLAGDTALSDLASALDRYDAYSAMLVAGDGLGGLDPSVVLGERVTPEQAEALLEEFEPCTGVTGVAAGIADDGEPLMLMVITSASDDAATANAALVEAVLTEGANPRNQRPWSEMIEIESVETEGTTTTISARPLDIPLVAWSQPIFDRSFPPC